MNDEPGPLTLSHLHLDVADLDRSERFYRDVLALPVTRRNDSLLVRWRGALLVCMAGEPAPSGSFHFGFRVDRAADVDAWFARLSAHGVVVVEPPAGRGAVYVGRLRDPDGYPIEIYCEQPDS